VQGKAEQQQEVSDVVVPAKAFSPEEDRMDHAQSVNHYGQQKEMAVGEPGHKDTLNLTRAGASGFWPACATDGDVVY
jgi:hypothetical protein